MNSKNALPTTLVPSTNFTTGAYSDGRGAEPAIRFGYPKVGSEIQGGIKFRRVGHPFAFFVLMSAYGWMIPL